MRFINFYISDKPIRFLSQKVPFDLCLVFFITVCFLMWAQLQHSINFLWHLFNLFGLLFFKILQLYSLNVFIYLHRTSISVSVDGQIQIPSFCKWIFKLLLNENIAIVRNASGLMARLKLEDEVRLVVK